MSLPDRLLLVLEPAQASRDLIEALAAAGGRWFWLRAKALSPAEAELLLWRLLPLPPGVTLSLGGHPALAATLGLGCHLPRDGDVGAARRLALALLGFSAHDLVEAAAAQAAGADYVTLSPVYPPASKPLLGRPLGLPGLAGAARLLERPVVALGGITPARAAACLEAGAAAVAGAGGSRGAADPAQAVRTYLEALGPVGPPGAPA